MKTRLLPAGFALRPDRSLYYTLLLMLVSISSVLAQTGTIRYVKAGGTGNGSSWASASGNLQAMINASASGDQVWVAAGTYKPTTTTDRTISFSMRSNLAIYGGFVGNETALSARPVINPITGNPGSGQPSSTTLSGDIGAVGNNSDNSYHVINNFNGQTTTAILDGFVITGGNANLINSNRDTDSGGGMRNIGHTSPLIRNCSFLANSALSFGGAIYNGAPGCASDSSPTLINCFFQGNSAKQGGAMANSGAANDVDCGGRSNPTLINCSFVANSARFGGAMFNSGFGGGGYGQSSPTLTNCSFVANSAIDDYGIGGAMYNVGTSTGRTYAKLTNCSFQGNTATYQGGAIANDGSDGVCSPTLTNCSFQGNTASYQGWAMFSTSVSNTTTGYCTPQMTNCVVFGNGGTNTFYGIQAYPRVSFSLVEASATVGWQDIEANQKISVSPFAATNTTQLRANSPAINAGDGSVDAGATDLAGNPRIVGCKIDMGAFEFQYTFLPLAINAQPASSSVVCAGTVVSVPVSVSGTVSGYQWYKDSFTNPVAGQTSATLTLNNPQPGNAGSYSLVVTSTCNSLTSTAFNLTVNKSTVSISPSSATVCQGQSVTLTASGSSSYTWNNNTTGNTLTATTTGTYSVTGVDGNGCSNTASAQVTVYRPNVSISPGSVSICEGQSALLTASGASSYTWNDNTTGNTLTATTTGTYSVTGVDGRGCSNTATASVTVNNVPTVSISASPSATITQGSSVTLTAVATGATAVTWVTGSTSNSIVVSPTTSTPYSVTARNAAGCTASASLTITVLLPTCSPIQYVTQQGAGLRDGSSWSNALGANQLQIAINTAADCGGNRQVWVAAGVYKPTNSSDRTLSFSMRNGVAIYGGLAGTETALTDRPAINPATGQPSSTTLSGDIGSLGNTSDNSFRVISNPASLSLTMTAVLDGFVITGGAGGTLGGGMFNDASSPTIRNCSFVSNAVSVTSGSTSRGGAMYNGNGSSPQLTNCSFQSNSLSGSNGSVSYGGAISNFTNSSPLLLNCSFLGNSVSGSASNFGGAMANNVNSNPQLINCSFLNNSAVGGTTTRGGAINNGSSNLQLINCSFLSNSVSGASTNLGGAIANGNTSVQLTNCVLFNNGGNNTFYNVGNSTVASVTATYSLFDDSVTGYTSDPTNLTASSSPFTSTTSTQLATGSPAINTGSNQAYQSAGGPTTDLAGSTRVVSGTIDMGAYEYQSCLATLSLTNPSVTTAVQNSPFSSTFTTSGGASPYSFSLSSGTLPIGLTLTTSGVLSGTPTQTGSSSITVRAIDANGCSGISSPYTLTVISGPVLSGFAASASSLCVGSVATFTATVSNLTGSYSYTLTNGNSLFTGTATTSTFSQSVTAAGTGSQSFVLTVSANDQSASSVTALTVNPLPVASLINNGPLSCTTTSVTLTAGGGSSYTFVSGNGVVGTPGTANTLAVSTPGTYSVTVALASGCVSTTTTVVTTDQNVPTVSINPSSATLSCASPSVSLTAVGSGTVRWNTGETTPMISVSVAGPYSVTATGDNGCTAVASVSVSQDNAAPVASLVSSGNLTCSVTSVTLTASPGGQAGATLAYRFSGEATQIGNTNQAVVIASGTYSVTVISANGCSAVASTSVSQDQTAPVASLVSSGSLTCSVTSVTLTASPNVQRYVFSNGATQIGNGPTATVSTAGIYSATVVSANGCSSVASTTVAGDVNVPTASLTNNGPISCSSTSVRLTASGGGTYRFSSEASQVGNGPTATVSTAGIYSVTVTGNNGCTATASTTVTGDQSAPIATLTSDGPLSCTKTRVILTASGGVNYAFAGPGLSQTGATATASVNTAGIYSVTVTNTNNCSATTSTTVTSSTAAVAIANPTVTAAAVGQVFSQPFTATGGTSPYRYSLTSGNLPTGLNLATTGVLSGTPTQSGSFTITVLGQDATGCSGVSAAYVLTVTNANPTLTGLTASPGAVCAGNVATFTATVGNLTGSYTYTLTNGLSVPLTGSSSGSTFSQSVTVVGTGSQNFTLIVSANGQTASSETALTVNPLPVASLTNNGPLTCAQSSVTLTAGGAAGVPGNSYTFASGNGVLGTPGPVNSVVVSTAGIYSVTVASASGCMSTTSTSVTADQTAPSVGITPSSATLSCASPSVSLTALGTGSVRWSTGETSPSISVNVAGTFSVTLTSGNGCTAMASVVVGQDNSVPLASLVSSGTLDCAITSVTLTASAGGQAGATPTYRFSEGATQIGSSNQALVSSSGTYSVTVISANGCSSVASVSVGQDNTAPVASLVSSGSLTCSVTSVTLTASPNGQNYQFSNGSSQIGNTNQAVVTALGTYSVTVLSNNGCSSVASTTVAGDVNVPTASLTNTGPLSCTMTSVTLTASGGSTYRFSRGASQVGNGPTATVSSAGVYSVTVIGSNGCTTTASTTVTGDQRVPVASLINNGPLSCSITSVMLTASGGNTYRFSNGATQIDNGPTATVSTAGVYSVTVISTNGCSAVASTTVVGDVNVPIASLTSNGPISCSSTSVRLTASGGVTYRFSSGASQVGNGPTATVSTAGIYSVTVTGDNGCTATASTTVTGDQTVPVASLTNDGPLSCTKTSVILTAGGSGRYSFSDGATQMGNGNTATVSSAGTYSVTVTGTNGCMATASTLVTGDQSAPIATLTDDGPLSCTKTRVILTASGGENYTFAGPGLSQTGATATASATTAGIYSVTVTNTNNCSATTSTTVTSSTAAVAIANPMVTAATVGQAFSQPFTATGGTSPYRYSLTSGNLPTGLSLATTGVLSGTPTQSGSFTITVLGRDANGCSGVSAAYVLTVTNANPTLTGLTASPGAVCVGNVATFTATVGNLTSSYNYTLTNGLSAPLTGSSSGSAFSQSVTAVGTGTQNFTLIVSANGQTASSETALTVNPLPVASLTNNGPLTCAQSSVTITAGGASGVPGNSYTFASSSGVLGTPGPANTVVVSTAGTYSVTVASASGCVSSTSALVTADQTAPSVGIIPSSATLSCASPTVSLTAVGSGSVRWSTGETTPVILVSVAGPYSVTVVSANGCSAVASTSVSQDNAAPMASLVSSGSLTCAVTSVSLTASPNGQRYVFSGGATQIGNTNQATVSASGIYSVTVVSANGCSSVASTTVAGDVTVPQAGLTNNGPISCLMSLVTLTARGGDVYRFSNGATQVGNGPTAAVSTAGVYSVTVVSANGCTATASTTVVSDQGEPTASLTTSGPLSCSATSVTLTASPSGQGYQFSEGATQIGSSNQALVSASGTYSVTVVSANGCTSVASVSVGQDNTAPVASLVSSGSLTCSVTSVTLTANSNGQRYVFSGGASQIGNTNQAVVNASGIYSVTVVSGNGCTSVAQTTVEADQSVSIVTITPSSATLTCASPTVNLTAVGNGSVRWSTGETTPSISVGVAGIYSVTLTSGNGCTASANVVISQDQQVPTASIAANPSLTITQGQSAILTAAATGSAGPFAFRWSTGQTTPSISVSAAGPYSVSVTGSNGCSATTSAVLSLTRAPIVEAPFAITAVTTLNCTPILSNRYSISFIPRYSGLTGQPVAFRVVNELLPTTEPGPYTIQLYSDNPRISLGAVQTGTSGESTFDYDWLAACLASTAANTPPRLVTVIPPQSATVGVGYSYVIPAGTFTDDQTPGSLRLSAQGLPPGISLSGYTLSGVASTTVGSPFRVILTATDPGDLSVSTSFGLAVAPAPVEPPQPSQPFAITGISMLSCTPIADRININFSPRYVGLTGQPIAFRIENELAATNEPGPYSLTLYRDNPVIMLKATQTGSVGEASFTYNWLAVCATQGQDNTPPRVVSPVGNQTVVAGTAVNLNLANVFLDQETPQGLSLSATGLPSGLVLVGTAIQGVTSITGVSTVVVTATDGGGLSASTGCTLMVTAPNSPTVGEPGSFTITGVQTLSCVVVSGGQRAVTFQPQYGGTTGGPINLSVINERATTTDPGPYTLSLYTDNPTITLNAQQGSTVATYRYNWLAGCTPAARVGSGEASTRLTVRVLGNPVEGNTAEVEIRGVSGQPVQLNVVDLQGKLVNGQRIEQAGAVEWVSLPLGASNGILLLQVSTPTQRQQVKLLRTN